MPRLFAARAAVGLALVVATGTLVLPPTSASAAALSAPTLSKYTVARGESFTVSGTGCYDPGYDPNTEGGAPYFVSVIGGAFSGGTDAAGSDGAWSLTMDVGGHLGPGTFPIRASCLTTSSGWRDYPAVTVTVIGEPLPPKPWEVPPRPGGYTPGAPATPPAGQPTTPRTTTPGTAATDTAPGTSSSAAPTPTPAAPALPLTPSPAPGCADCTRITAGEALAPGQRLSLRYTGFQPGEQVTLVMRSAPVTLGTFTADATGTVTADVTLPATAEAGEHTLHLSGPVTGEQVVGIRVAAAPRDRETVVAAPASRGTALLLPLGLGGAGTVLLAAGGFVLHRRRVARSAQATDTPIAAPIA